MKKHVSSGRSRQRWQKAFKAFCQKAERDGVQFEDKPARVKAFRCSQINAEIVKTLRVQGFQALDARKRISKAFGFYFTIRGPVTGVFAECVRPIATPKGRVKDTGAKHSPGFAGLSKGAVRRSEDNLTRSIIRKDAAVTAQREAACLSNPGTYTVTLDGGGRKGHGELGYLTTTVSVPVNGRFLLLTTEQFLTAARKVAEIEFND